MQQHPNSIHATYQRHTIRPEIDPWWIQSVYQTLQLSLGMSPALGGKYSKRKIFIQLEVVTQGLGEMKRSDCHNVIASRAWTCICNQEDWREVGFPRRGDSEQKMIKTFGRAGG